MTSRKNLILVTVVIGLLTVGTAFAYFTDQDEKINTFTVGNVDISLDEPTWNPEEGKNIVPMESINKDPQITNTGVNDVFVFMQVSVPAKEVNAVNDDGSMGELKKSDLFSYSVNGGWRLIEERNDEDNTVYCYGYVDDDGLAKVLRPSETTKPLFDSVKLLNISEGILNEQELSINIRSAGIQADGLSTEKPEELYEMIRKSY